MASNQETLVSPRPLNVYPNVKKQKASPRRIAKSFFCGVGKYVTKNLVF
jgi:hypothetical protein